MIVDVSTLLPATPHDVIEHVRSPRSLLHVSRPLVKFVPREPAQLPDVWSDGTYWLSLYLVGVIPMGRQAIVISYPEMPGKFSMRDNGYSALIQKWDHVITVEAEGDGARYRDRVMIEAGWLTPLCWLFAQAFYRHRQRRWFQWARHGFQGG